MVGLDCQKNTVGRFYGLPLNIRKIQQRVSRLRWDKEESTWQESARQWMAILRRPMWHMPLRKSRQSIPLPHPL